MKNKWKDYILGVLYKFPGQIVTLIYSLNIVYRLIQRRKDTLLNVFNGPDNHWKFKFFFLNKGHVMISSFSLLKITGGVFAILLPILTKKAEQ